MSYLEASLRHGVAVEAYCPLGHNYEMRAIDALDRGPSGRIGPHPDTHQG